MAVGETPSSAVPESFCEFVEAYYQPAYRFAFSLSGNHADACDITQQAFYLAHLRSGQLRNTGKRKQWLFTILHREFLRTVRRAAAHPQTTLELAEPALPLITVDHAAALDGKTVVGVLQTLEEHFRLPLVLFYLDQLSYKEIAAVLEIPIGTVMSRLARGKELLRQQLEVARTEHHARVVSVPSLAAQGGLDG